MYFRVQTPYRPDTLNELKARFRRKSRKCFAERGSPGDGSRANRHWLTAFLHPLRRQRRQRFRIRLGHRRRGDTLVKQQLGGHDQRFGVKVLLQGVAG